MGCVKFQVLIKLNFRVFFKFFFRFGVSLPAFFDGFGVSKYILASYVSYTQQSARTKCIIWLGVCPKLLTDSRFQRG